MPVYIMLTSLTAQGVQTLKSNPDRLREVNRDVEELGAKVLHQWATLGPFDFVNVIEAPDAATIARVSVALGARGIQDLVHVADHGVAEFIRDEPAFDHSAGCPGAHLGGVGSGAAQQVQAGDDHRLACAGLAGEHRQTAVELGGRGADRPQRLDTDLG